MKLATYDNGTLDGQLLVVSRDLSRAVPANDVAPNLLAALQSWDRSAPRLSELAKGLEAGTQAGAIPFEPARALAPLPRAPQWLDGSAFLNHGRLMDQAFGHSPLPDFETVPLMYQGASDDFLGPMTGVPFPGEELGIDFEGEFGVVVGPVPMGCSAEAGLGHVRLVVQVNDWSLRAAAPYEMKRGFGFLQAKPSTAFAPVAVTPDELGSAWSDGRLALDLEVWRGEEKVGSPNGREMTFTFGDLIAHAAKTRRLTAGTIIGSGTVSNESRAAGSACLAERRGIEMIEQGMARTPYLRFGERIRMQARDPLTGERPFGAIDQVVVRVN